MTRLMGYNIHMHQARAINGLLQGIGVLILLLVVAPSDGFAQCGDYVHYGDEPTAPRCDEAPTPLPSPMPTEGRSPADDWALIGEFVEPLPQRQRHIYLSPLLNPQTDADAIFHPPRSTRFKRER